MSQFSIHDLSHIHVFDVLIAENGGDTAVYVPELQIKLGDLDFFPKPVYNSICNIEKCYDKSISKDKEEREI